MADEAGDAEMEEADPLVKVKTETKVKVEPAAAVLEQSLSPSADDDADSASSKSTVSAGLATASAGSKAAASSVRPLLSPLSLAKPSTPKKTASPAAKTSLVPAIKGKRPGANLLAVVKPAPPPTAVTAEKTPSPPPAAPISHPAEELEFPTISDNAIGFHKANSNFLRFVDFDSGLLLFSSYLG
jgi:hypothetical protein